MSTENKNDMLVNVKTIVRGVHLPIGNNNDNNNNIYNNLSLKECYTWLKGWKAAPTHTVTGIEELHQQLLPTKIYHQKKSEVNTTDDIMCRMCGEKPACLAHVLAGCSVLAQTKYLSRHNAALKNTIL